MSFTYYGYKVEIDGQRPMSGSFDTYAEAYEAAARIAATSKALGGYTYRFRGFLDRQLHEIELPKDWETLRIVERYDMGAEPSTMSKYNLSRKRLEDENAKPYGHATNLEEIRRPDWAKPTFEKGGKTYDFVSATIDYRRGLEIIYKDNPKDHADEIRKEAEQLGIELTTDPEQWGGTHYHIDRLTADQWKEGGLSAANFEREEASRGIKPRKEKAK